ncbi:MAG: hypothetical protein HC852_11165 [Acaryochloridaceae cyanobacterium RU_4_10]|nr:hypothetical protein [Acaryochloridaceae cyanobacterium RU_4_10]
METKTRGHFTKKDLTARGWTAKMIERYLKEPDRLEDNPHCKSGAPMHCYEPDRVKRLELEVPSIKQAIERKAAKLTQKRAEVNQVENSLLEFVESLHIKVYPIPIADLLSCAIAHNNRSAVNPVASLDLPPQQLFDLCVVYLRSPYAPAKERLGVTSGPAVARLRERIDTEIKAAYPDLYRNILAIGGKKQ